MSGCWGRKKRSRKELPLLPDKVILRERRIEDDIRTPVEGCVQVFQEVIQ